jgi:hypothetical protein
VTCWAAERAGTGLVGAALAVSVAAAPAAAVAPDPGEGQRRFAIVEVTDSTVTFLAPRERWLRVGAYGIAVDPRQRDALVGRLRVLRRSGDSSVALVTGQTTRMSTDYVAIFRRPSTPVLRQRAFWGGLSAGLVAGAGLVLLVVGLR